MGRIHSDPPGRALYNKIDPCGHQPSVLGAALASKMDACGVVVMAEQAVMVHDKEWPLSEASRRARIPGVRVWSLDLEFLNMSSGLRQEHAVA